MHRCNLGVALEQETILGFSGPGPKRLLAPSLTDIRGKTGIRALYQAIRIPRVSHSIAEIPLSWGDIAPPLRMLSKGETLRKGVSRDTGPLSVRSCSCWKCSRCSVYWLARVPRGEKSPRVLQRVSEPPNRAHTKGGHATARFLEGFSEGSLKEVLLRRVLRRHLVRGLIEIEVLRRVLRRGGVL